MGSMKGKLIWFLSLTATLVLALSFVVVRLDPFFHYHAPLDGYYYTLDDERSQSIGIIRFFDYDAIITGTSLVRDFKASRMKELFGMKTVKLPISGATWHETALLLNASYESGHDPQIVLRSLDVNHLVEESDAVRRDLGEFPDHLYDDILWNDVRYVCNRDVLFKYCVPMIARRLKGGRGGHTSFDMYDLTSLAPGNVLDGRDSFSGADNVAVFGEEDRRILTDNLRDNVLSIADEHPETEFYFYIPPYNIAWWGGLIEEGQADRTKEILKVTIPELLARDNVRVYCFDDRYELTTDLTMYADEYHYVPSVADDILSWIQRGEGELTVGTWEAKLDEMWEFYTTYDYAVLFK